MTFRRKVARTKDEFPRISFALLLQNTVQEEYNGASAVYTKYENEKQLIEQKEKEELN